MASPARMFWERRDTLWPASAERTPALVRTSDDDVDRKLERMLADAGINSATYRSTLGCRGLASSQTLIGLEPLLGSQYRPYRELRGFWVPFAACAAQFYETRKALRPNAKPLLKLLRAIDDLRRFSRQHGDGAIHLAWDGSPFRTLAPDPVALQVQIDDVLDRYYSAAETYKKYLDLPLAQLKLEKTLSEHDNAERRINVDVYCMTFIDIMSIAAFRFSKRLPSNRQLLRNFIAGAWYLVHGEEMGNRGDRTIRELGKSRSLLSSRINDIGTMLEVTEIVWHEIISAGPFQKRHRSIMRQAIYDAYMGQDRPKFWPDLTPSGKPEQLDDRKEER